MPTVSQLPAATSITTDDYLLLVDDPAGTPNTQHARVGDVIALATTLLLGADWAGTYAGGTAYTAGKIVSYSGSTYIALDSTTGDTPDSSPTHWQLWVAQGPQGEDGPTGTGTPGAAGIPNAWAGNYVAMTSYALGTAVSYQGGSYVATVDPVSTSVPTDGSQWAKISNQGDKGAKPFNLPTPWITATTYHEGNSTTPADAVFEGGASYACVTTHTSGTFATDLTDGLWAEVAAAGGVAGVADDGVYVDVDNTDPENPIVGLNTDQASGIPVQDASGHVFPYTLVSAVERAFSASTTTAGVSTGTHTDSMGTITVTADSAATGGHAYNRRIRLKGNVTLTFVGASDRCSMYWTNTTTSTRLPPTFFAQSSGSGSIHTFSVDATDTTVRNAHTAQAYELTLSWISGGTELDAATYTNDNLLAYAVPAA